MNRSESLLRDAHMSLFTQDMTKPRKESDYGFRIPGARDKSKSN